MYGCVFLDSMGLQPPQICFCAALTAGPANTLGRRQRRRQKQTIAAAAAAAAG